MGILGQICPPIIKRWVSALSPYGWHGDYPDHATAARMCGDYSDPEILRKVESAVTAVLRGEAAFERDGVAFAAAEFRWQLLSCLLHSLRTRQRLSVLDVGGSLASCWLQHRTWLDLPEVSWAIVEQTNYCAAGRLHFRGLRPLFFDNLDEAIAASRPTLLLCSSSLQYLPDPWSLLGHPALRDSDLLIDLTPVTDRGRDRFTIQRVPPSIYKASYPCRILDESRLAAVAALGRRLTATWVNPVDMRLPGCFYRGLFATRSDPKQ